MSEILLKVALNTKTLTQRLLSMLCKKMLTLDICGTWYSVFVSGVFMCDYTFIHTNIEYNILCCKTGVPEENHQPAVSH
jgi:hypothetical protein